MKHSHLVQLAIRVAIKRVKGPRRDFLLGAVGVRRDGTIVWARNLPAREIHYASHAEALLCRKLDKGSTVYVARVNKRGQLRQAKPCRVCEARLRSKGVKKVYYTQDTGEIGVQWYE